MAELTCDKTATELMAILAPEVVALVVNPADVATYVCLAELRTGEDAFGAKYQLAIAYLALHLIQCTDDANNNGSINTSNLTAKSEGKLSLQYKTSSSSKSGDDMLKSTYWGGELLVLRNECIISVMNICS